MRRPFAAALVCVSILALGPGRVTAAEPTKRSVYITVVDEKGQPVLGVTAADLAVKEAGKDREVVSVEPATDKMRLALMVEETLTPQGGVRLALADFIKRMVPTAEIALVVVGQRNRIAVDFTSDANALIGGINDMSLSTERRTTMVPEGVYEMAKAFQRDKPVRPVMVLLALEVQQVSAEQPQNVLNELARSRAMMHVVSMEGGGGASSDVGSMQDMAGRAQVMGDGAKQSGGRRVEVVALTAFPRGLQQVADDLSSQYLVTYSLPDGVKPSDRLSVTLKKKGAVLRAPTKISDR